MSGPDAALMRGLADLRCRAHVDKDLQIYVCLSEDCSYTIKFFDDPYLWDDHMRRKHTSDWPEEIHLGVWYCDVDHPRSELFSNDVEFRAHMEDVHSEGPENINMYVRRRRMQVERAAGVCPLCETSPTAPGGSPLKTRTELLGHIVSHLRSLALLSLPVSSEDIKLYVDSEYPQSTNPSVVSALAEQPVERKEIDDLEPIQYGDQTYNFQSDEQDHDLPALTSNEQDLEPPPVADDVLDGLFRHYRDMKMEHWPLSQHDPFRQLRDDFPNNHSTRHSGEAQGQMSPMKSVSQAADSHTWPMTSRGGINQSKSHTKMFVYDPDMGHEVLFPQPGRSRSVRGAPEPRPGPDSQGIIINDQAFFETLFPTFEVQRDAKASFFIGQIFRVLWSEEPNGSAFETTRGEWTPGIALNHDGQRAYAKVRSFVVVGAGAESFYALPIITYGGRGVAGPRVVKSDHVIIYSTPKCPPVALNEQPAREETGMRAIPIRVEADTPTDTLDPMSRLNLAGVTVIQYDVKVQHLGKVHNESILDLERHFEDVWGRALPVS